MSHFAEQHAVSDRFASTDPAFNRPGTDTLLRQFPPPVGRPSATAFVATTDGSVQDFRENEWDDGCQTVRARCPGILADSRSSPYVSRPLMISISR